MARWENEDISDLNIPDAPSIKEIFIDTNGKESSEEKGSVCVYEHETGVYQLNSEVETINDNLYISVSEVSEEDQGSLSESEVPSLDSVDFEDASYTLGDIFDTNDGKTFVQLNPAQ